MKRSNIHLQYNAPVTLTFFFLSLASLALGHLTNGWTTYHLFSVYRSSLADPLFFVRLFGHVLGHAGWDHFIGNMLLFLVIAPPLEERYGSRTLLSGILMTALVSGILQYVLFPSSALLGASGIVFMLIMLSSLAGSRNGGIPITLILVGALYLSQQVYDILFVQDNVANFMHIVGGACGTVFGFAVRRKEYAEVSLMKILITGFDPFGGESVNPACEAVKPQAVGKPLGTPSMDLHQIARGLTLAVEAIIENERDLTVNR